MPRLRKIPVKEPEEMIIEDSALPTEDIVIELSDDDVLVPDATVVTEPAEHPVVEPVADEPLKRALEAQQRAEEIARNATRERDEANRRAQDRDEELVRTRGEREDAEYNSILTSIAAEQSTIDKAEADYASFAQIGDWAAASKAQREMSVASARLDRLDDGKRNFDQRREAAKIAPPERRPAAPAAHDFEQKLSALALPANAQAWLRAHPEFINDTPKNIELGAVHNYLDKTRKIAPFSPAYFDALDTEFGFKAPPVAAEKPPEPTHQPQRRSIPVSAPVSRDVPGAGGERQSARTITLNPDEVQIARSSFSASDMTNAQKERLYAQNKAKLAAKRANGSYPSREQA